MARRPIELTDRFKRLTDDRPNSTNRPTDRPTDDLPTSTNQPTDIDRPMSTDRPFDRLTDGDRPTCDRPISDRPPDRCADRHDRAKRPNDPSGSVSLPVDLQPAQESAHAGGLGYCGEGCSWEGGGVAAEILLTGRWMDARARACLCAVQMCKVLEFWLILSGATPRTQKGTPSLHQSTANAWFWATPHTPHKRQPW